MSSSFPENLNAELYQDGSVSYASVRLVISSLAEQNGCHLADEILKSISMNEKCYILILISLKIVPKGPLDNKSALV